jgi:hypothetical protein
MRVLPVFLLVLGMGVPVAAQDGPIARSVKQYARPDVPTPTTVYTTRMRSPVLFWAGAGLVAGGTIVAVAALTWERDSDLSLEDVNTRLGRDLAPCGTDPKKTRMPIADCKVNSGLLWLGGGMLAGGGVLMAVGGQTVQIVELGPRAFAMRVRF